MTSLARPCLVLCMAAFVGCGGATEQTKRDDNQLADDWERKMAAQGQGDPIAPKDDSTKVVQEPRITTGSIRRVDVLPWISKGVGRFLQNVDVRASMKSGKFVGFEIVSFFPNDPSMQRVDLLPGDIVTSINDRKLERPGDASQILESLRTAPELRVGYLRNGEKRMLRFTIFDDDEVPPTS